MTGLIKKDEKMPSVRELASQYAINPNTIQRAYRDLENDGYIYSVPGKGSFAVDVNEISGKHIAEIYDRLDIVLKDFDIAGESRQHIADYVLNEKKMLSNTGSIEAI
jgi:GntR family transcriptional regulator